MLETTFLTLPYTRSDQYLGLVHVVVQQKPTQHCKAIILQLKLEKKVSKSHWLEFHENPLRKQTQLENLLFFLSLSSFSSCLKLGWVEVARAPADILIFRSQHGLKNEKKKKAKLTPIFAKGKCFTYSSTCACMHVQSLSGIQLFCDPMDCSLPVSSVHGISQAKTVEWVAIFYYRGSSQPRDQTCISCIGRWILYHWATLDRST